MGLGKSKILSQGAAGGIVGTDNFNTVTYTGNGSTQSITGVGFQPDFVWVKERSATGQHSIFDAIRGATKRLDSSSNSGQSTATSSLTSFDSDGFTFGNESGNNNGVTNVAWCWKAGGATTSSNSSGTITTTTTVNQAAGFSILTYNGASNATSDTSDNGGGYYSVGHGLGVAPSLVFVKKTNNVGGWYVGGTALSSSGTNGNHLVLNTATAQVGQANILWGGAQTFNATTFGLGGWDVVNRNGDSYVAYCFADIAGFQKFGTYVATGSAGSPTVTTGFQPRFVMVKNLDKNQEWIIVDSARNNGANSLRPDSTAAENTAGDNAITLNSNGFTIAVSGSGVNYQSGDDFLYWAIA